LKLQGKQGQPFSLESQPTGVQDLHGLCGYAANILSSGKKRIARTQGSAIKQAGITVENFSEAMRKKQSLQSSIA